MNPDRTDKHMAVATGANGTKTQGRKEKDSYADGDAARDLFESEFIYSG